MVDQGNNDPAGQGAPRSPTDQPAPGQDAWPGGRAGNDPRPLPPPPWAGGPAGSGDGPSQPWGNATTFSGSSVTDLPPPRQWREPNSADANSPPPSRPWDRPSDAIAAGVTARQQAWAPADGAAASPYQSPWGETSARPSAGPGGGGSTDTPQAAPVAVQPAYPPPIRPIYDGTLGALYVIYLKNLVLGLTTLGLYRFWGRTRLRRYLWSHTSAFGDRFEYRGTGLEMFFGFLTGLGLLLVIVGLGVGAYEWSGEDNPLNEVGLDTTISWGFLILTIPLLYVAQYGSLRYRLSRTSWRGIRGRLEGSAWRFGALYTALSIANMLCAYLLLPVLQTQTARYQLRNARLGTAPVEFAGTPGDIYGRYIGYYFLNIAAWVGVFVVVGIAIASFFAAEIPSPEKYIEQLGQLDLRAILILGLAALFAYFVFSVMILPVRCWYEAYLLRYLVSRTRLSGMVFVTAVGTRQMWGYLVLNYLILILTVGMGFPWVLHRTMRLITEQLWIYGVPDARQIQQKADDGSAAGEGLLDLLSPGAV